MSRYERTQFFEALYHLQAGYAERSDLDRRSELSIDDAVTYAEAVMFAIETDDAAAKMFDEYAEQQETPALGDPRD
jgi:hypothetical protein